MKLILLNEIICLTMRLYVFIINDVILNSSIITVLYNIKAGMTFYNRHKTEV